MSSMIALETGWSTSNFLAESTRSRDTFCGIPHIGEEETVVYDLVRHYEWLRESDPALAAAMLRDAARLRHDLKGPIFTIDGYAEVVADTLPKLLSEMLVLAASHTDHEHLHKVIAHMAAHQSAAAAAPDVPTQLAHLGITKELDGLDETAMSLLTKTAEVLDALGRIRAIAGHLGWLNRATTALRNHQKERVDTHAAISDAVAAFRHDFTKDAGSVTTGLHAQRHLVSGERGAFASIISNLIQNSLYAADHQPCHVIITTTNDEDDGLVIAYEDDGPGVPTSIVEHIFEAGVSTTGSGLGMAYARHAAEFHGGTITVDPTPQKGARFVITMPTVEPETEPDW